MQHTDITQSIPSDSAQQCTTSVPKDKHGHSPSNYSLDQYKCSSYTYIPKIASRNRPFESLCSAVSQLIIVDPQSIACDQSSPSRSPSKDIHMAGEDEDEDDGELNAPAFETILFYEILHEFPDLAEFIRHDDFDAFSQIWLELQRQKDMARLPENRPAVQAWLKSSALQIHFNLVSLVKSNPGNTDPYSEPRRMFSAWRRLKDRIEVTHQIFQIIEDRRALHNEGPKEAIAELKQAATQFENDLHYLKQHPTIVPVVNAQTDDVHLRLIDQIEMADITKHATKTYNLMSYDSNTASIAAVNEDNKNLIAEDRQILQTNVPLSTAPYKSSTGLSLEAKTINSFNTESFKETVESSNDNNHPISTTPIDVHDTIQSPVMHSNPVGFYDACASPSASNNISQSHLYKHYAGWSAPVTPQTEATQQQFFNSLPTSPDAVTQSNGHMFAPCNTATDSMASPATLTAIHSPINTLSEDSLDYQFIDSDLVTPSLKSNYCKNPVKEGFQTRSNSVESMSTDPISVGGQKRSRKSNQEYRPQDIEETDEEVDEVDEVEAKPQQLKGLTRAQSKRKKRKLNLSDLRNIVPVTRSQTRRTATSYDAETTHYLKSIFYDVYSRSNKLTKDERRQIQSRTGLKPRNITYWFSNHKRRFHASLELFRKVVDQSQGQVKTYDDFLVWRRMQGLPEEILDNEMINEEF